MKFALQSFRTAAIAALLAFCATTPLSNLHAQDTATAPAPATTKLPSPRVLHDKHIKAIGGKDAYKTIKSVVAEGTVEIKGAGIKGTLKTVEQMPNLQRVEQTFPQIGKMIQIVGKDGGYNVNPMMGNMPMTDKQFQQAKTQMALSRNASLEDVFKSAKTTAATDFAGGAAYEVTAISKQDETIKLYYSKDQEMLVGMSMVASSPQGDVPVTVTFKDYKKQGPIMMSMSQEAKAGPMGMDIKITNVKFNVPVPAGSFDKP
ncbi:MAG: hypothetical protein AAFP69_11735 [Planctomycetota bacterium]